MAKKLFGWIPPQERTRAQKRIHGEILERTPEFQLPGYREQSGRFALWKAFRDVTGGDVYINQTTGSCVGAGGGNMLRTLMAVEILAGELEEWKEIWWPFTYGRSRFRAGMTTPGEGSFGSAWMEAAVKPTTGTTQRSSGLS